MELTDLPGSHPTSNTLLPGSHSSQLQRAPSSPSASSCPVSSNSLKFPAKPRWLEVRLDWPSWPTPNTSFSYANTVRFKELEVVASAKPVVSSLTLSPRLINMVKLTHSKTQQEEELSILLPMRMDLLYSCKRICYRISMAKMVFSEDF